VTERKYHWIHFVLVLRAPNKKTDLWQVATNDDNEVIGLVKFWPAWRRYAFFPEADTFYEQNCLWDIADFCARMTEEWKQLPKTPRTGEAA